MHAADKHGSVETVDDALLLSCLSDLSHHPSDEQGDILKRQFTRTQGDLRKLLENLREAVTLLAHDRVVALSEELDNFSIGVSLIGQVKAGKTALANALIGKPEMLPSDVNPWTSVVTSVHINTPKPSGKTAVFNFFTTEEWINMVEAGGSLGEIANRAGFSDEVDEMRSQIREMQQRTEQRLGRNFAMLMGSKHSFLGFSSEMLRRYVCLGDETSVDMPDGRYADVTKSAELYIDSENYRVPTIIRDTPGVNDPFLMRESVTLNSIGDTDIFVLVLGAQQSFSTVDVGLLRIIRSMKREQVIFFVNRVDELNDPATQIPEIDAYIRQVLRDQSLPDDIPIVFGSAAWAEAAAFGILGSIGGIAGNEKLEKLHNKRQSAQKSNAPLGTAEWTAAKTTDLSGMFELRRIIESKSVADIGLPHLQSIARRALDIARSSRLFLEQIDDATWATSAEFDIAHVAKALEDIHEKSRDEIAAEIETAAAAMRDAILQTYEKFFDHEKAQVEAELSTKKHIDSWHPDLDLLRRSLTAAYLHFANEVPEKIGSIHCRAAKQVQDIYNAALNNPVKIISVEPPEVKNPKNPTCLMRTMSLDITMSWLENLMTGGARQKTYLRKLQQLVSEEEQQTLHQIETDCVADFAAENAFVLDEFFENHLRDMKSIAMLNDLSHRDEALRALGMEQEVKVRTSVLGNITVEIQKVVESLALCPDAAEGR